MRHKQGKSEKGRLPASQKLFLAKSEHVQKELSLGGAGGNMAPVQWLRLTHRAWLQLWLQQQELPGGSVCIILGPLRTTFKATPSSTLPTNV